MRTARIAIVALGLLGAWPTAARADLTAFWGAATSPATRPARGFGIGVGLLVLGFEFEYATIREEDAKSAPGVTTGSFNLLVTTPSRNQLYATIGGGGYREVLQGNAHNGLTSNLGIGAKIGLFGPVRLRLDYRVFALLGHPHTPAVQRFYAGFNLTF